MGKLLGGRARMPAGEHPAEARDARVSCARVMRHIPGNGQAGGRV